MPDQPPAGLEQPLLETRQGPAPDGDGKDEPTQEIAEVVRDDGTVNVYAWKPTSTANPTLIASTGNRRRPGLMLPSGCTGDGGR
jgi:hypothetical protein